MQSTGQHKFLPLQDARLFDFRTALSDSGVPGPRTRTFCTRARSSYLLLSLLDTVLPKWACIFSVSLWWEDGRRRIRDQPG